MVCKTASVSLAALAPARPDALQSLPISPIVCTRRQLRQGYRLARLSAPWRRCPPPGQSATARASSRSCGARKPVQTFSIKCCRDVSSHFHPHFSPIRGAPIGDRHRPRRHQSSAVVPPDQLFRSSACAPVCPHSLREARAPSPLLPWCSLPRSCPRPLSPDPIRRRAIGHQYNRPQTYQRWQVPCGIIAAAAFVIAALSLGATAWSCPGSSGIARGRRIIGRMDTRSARGRGRCLVADLRPGAGAANVDVTAIIFRPAFAA